MAPTFLEARADWSTSLGKEKSIAVDWFPKHKAGDFEVQNWDVSRYLVYLND